MTRRLIPLLVLLAAAGCSSTKIAEPVAATPAAAPATPAPAAAGGSAAQPAPAPQSAIRSVTTPSAAATSPLDDPKSILARRSVYFDFDRYDLHAEDLPIVEAHGKHLSTARSARVRLEGHADERGGREYNLALGQKRAEAVKKALVVAGAADAALEPISFGKEKPLALGHDEAAWAKNRRVDLNYVAR